MRARCHRVLSEEPAHYSTEVFTSRCVPCVDRGTTISHRKKRRGDRSFLERKVGRRSTEGISSRVAMYFHTLGRNQRAAMSSKCHDIGRQLTTPSSIAEEMTGQLRRSWIAVTVPPFSFSRPTKAASSCFASKTPRSMRSSLPTKRLKKSKTFRVRWYLTFKICSKN